MPNITVGNDEIENTYVGDKVVNKIYTGSVLIYQAQPRELIDADGKNILDSDGNQILVY